jgi:hypothetical protein
MKCFYAYVFIYSQQVVAHRNGKGWRGGFVLSFLERLIKLDLRKWMELIRDFNLMPRVIDSDMSSVFLGRTFGSVTAVAPTKLSNYLNLARDPDVKSAQNYLLGGQQCMFPKMGLVEDRLAIERKLQRASTRVGSRRRRSSMHLSSMHLSSMHLSGMR